MRLESNVGMVRGNKTANKYVSNLKYKIHFKNMFLESRNRNGVKWIDILNMYSKNDLINWYNENIIKLNLLITKQYLKER